MLFWIAALRLSPPFAMTTLHIQSSRGRDLTLSIVITRLHSNRGDPGDVDTLRPVEIFLDCRTTAIASVRNDKQGEWVAAYAFCILAMTYLL